MPKPSEEPRFPSNEESEGDSLENDLVNAENADWFNTGGSLYGNPGLNKKLPPESRQGK